MSATAENTTYEVWDIRYDAVDDGDIVVRVTLSSVGSFGERRTLVVGLQTWALLREDWRKGAFIEVTPALLRFCEEEE